MSAILEGFQPMVPAEDQSGVRIEHVFTGASTMAPLPHLVDAQRRSDQRKGRDTWVLVGSVPEETLLINHLRSMLSSRAQEEGNNNNHDEGRWGVRCTQDIEQLPPDHDCFVVTTTEYMLIHLMTAKETTPTQFSDKMTFIIDLGWGNLTMKAAYAYDRLVRFVFDNKETSSHLICTISSDMIGPFNKDWVARKQDCKVIMKDEVPPSITFREETNEPLLAMDEIIEDLKRGKEGRAIILMEHKDALRLETIGPDLNDQCHFLSLSDGPNQTLEGLSNTSKHIITNGVELTHLGNIPGATHLILYPFRQGLVWDRETNQIAFQSSGFRRPKAELRYAMSCRDMKEVPEIHYLGPSRFFNMLEDEPIDSMVYTSHFDNHVLSSLSLWPEFPVTDLPLKIGRNPDLIELRLHWLICKGLLEEDETRVPRRAQMGLLRSYSFLKLTLLGRTVSKLVDPYITAIDSAHAACLVGQLFVNMRKTSAAVVDAVCSLAVVLTSRSGVTYIDAAIKPEEGFNSYMENPDSLASELCHRGAIWLAVCVWHFTLTNGLWKAATSPYLRVTNRVGQSTRVNCDTMVLWYEHTFAWESVANKLEHLFNKSDVKVRYAGEEHKLSPEELLDVEDMLVTAFMDKLAFVFVPARDGPFGYSMTTMTELERPTDEQMRLINLDKCWEEDKAAVGQDTPGIYCIFTHCRMQHAGGRAVATPYDLTYVSTEAVRRALDRANVPMKDGCLFSKIETDYKLDL